ncbi:hypothetical protein COCNU_05G000550 [Cocos nucifera]|uniref:Sulfite exporter TauE/SafE family protein n=1 Tax=Cocos nucifera TaxID=13894 RepID=A0A8K0I8F7_COCNU|nr:hypothetical protein COCNU_05G000550 [Cocos nucifera]
MEDIGGGRKEVGQEAKEEKEEMVVAPDVAIPARVSRGAIGISVCQERKRVVVGQQEGGSAPMGIEKELEFNWRIILVTVIGFLGSAFGTVGGVGGGGIFVPMLNLIIGFDTKAAAALSKCMIMGASASSVWYNLRVSHPSKEVPIIDYNLALLFQPMLMLGITVGVELSVVFPYWLITVLIIVLFLGTSSRSFFKGIEMWKQETMLKMEMEKQEQEAKSQLNENDVIIGSEYRPLVPQPEKSGLNNSEVCSPFYWVINILQVGDHNLN